LSTGLPESVSDQEAHRIREAYARRKTQAIADRYSFFNPGNLFIVQQRERQILRLLEKYGFRNLEGKKIFEVGCGTGFQLRELIKWGARPENVSGVDLLADRIVEARRLSPETVDLKAESAVKLEQPDATFDMVLISTVFTSILDDSVKQQIARETMRVLKPGGLVLWYDYHVNNPSNPDVRAVKKREIYRLFPGCQIDLRRITLAPPIARRLAPYCWLLCHLLEKIPWLRTHYLGAIRKLSATSSSQQSEASECGSQSDSACCANYRPEERQ
jgi:ubiquinone/menaquinone biosynthesis C-methylase UbiE